MTSSNSMSWIMRACVALLLLLVFFFSVVLAIKISINEPLREEELKEELDDREFQEREFIESINNRGEE